MSGCSFEVDTPNGFIVAIEADCCDAARVRLSEDFFDLAVLLDYFVNLECPDISDLSSSS